MPIDVMAEWLGGRRQPDLPASCPVVLHPGVSVVVCTRGRPEPLAALLESLRDQRLAPDEVIVVDASDGSTSENVTARFADGGGEGFSIRYVRVSGELRGLTRQRNLGAGLASRDLTAFFDDDVVVGEGCLEAMERVLREGGGTIVGVGASVVSADKPSRGIWYLRRLLWLVTSLQPGRYCGSGMSTPWDAEVFDETTVVDWLPGCGMLWPTRLVRAQQFREEFEGYAQGEDLEFSLRAALFGDLRVAAGAVVRDTHAPVGRPRGVERGYFSLRNRFLIHRIRPENLSLSRKSWFIYTWTMDTIFLLRHLPYPRRWVPVAQEVAGRVLAGCDLIRGRKARRFNERGSGERDSQVPPWTQTGNAL